MQAATQWIIATITAIFVAAVAFLQWRTAQQKAVLDLFERRRAIYDVVRNAVSRMTGSSAGFDEAREIEFREVVESAYFFFGDDIENYLKQMLSDIMDVRTVDKELDGNGTTDPETRRKMGQKRRAAWDRIQQFHTTGRALFARYMRFSQMVPLSMRLFDSWK